MFLIVIYFIWYPAFIQLYQLCVLSFHRRDAFFKPSKFLLFYSTYANSAFSAACLQEQQMSVSLFELQWWCGTLKERLRILLQWKPPRFNRGYVTVCVVMALLYYCSKSWMLLVWRGFTQAAAVRTTTVLTGPLQYFLDVMLHRLNPI